MWINLYEINLNETLISTVTLTLFFICIAIGMFIAIKKNIGKESGILVKIVKIVFIMWAIIFLVFFIIIIFTEYSNYLNTVWAYNNEKYNIVEGTVKNYKEDCDKDYSHHDDEYFEIENIDFAYREPDRWGYHAIRKNGGVITGNGQYLKICYIHIEYGDGTYKNVILRIDEYKKQ